MTLSDDGIENYSERFACPDCGISYPEIEPRLFSFNSPVGACPQCDGIGTQTIFDPALVVPDPSLTLKQGAIEVWSGSESFMYMQTLEAVTKHYKINMRTPFEKLPEEAQKALLYGSGRQKVRFEFSTSMQERVVERPFEGVIPNLERRYRETSSDDVREELAKYINSIDCPRCEGSRLTRA
ncbi:excinuclease ABC subunit UvrA, partial [Pseudomonadota bacterium]